MSEPVAAVDLGTNSVRLLVSRDGRDLERAATVTRLGQGVDRTRRLDPDAIARTVAVLDGYRELLDRHGVHRVRAVATSAARDATNRDELFDAVEQALGVRPELLAGDEEGRLAFRGATCELDPEDGPFLVCDVGGGSTELVVGTGEADAVQSMDVGAVRLSEAWLHGDPPTPLELANAIDVTRAWLVDVLRVAPEMGEARRLVGVAGTITTMAAVEIGLVDYDRDRIHHFVLTKAAAEDVFRTLATERRADRLHNPGLPADRVDTIVGGCCIVLTLMRHLDFDELLVSERDILDGIVAGLTEAPGPI